MLGHAQLFRPLDRLDATGLVEPVAVEFVHLRQHAGRPLALWAAHQRLVGKHLVRLHIHNGLVGKFKGEPDALCIATSIAISAGARQGLEADGERRVGVDHLGHEGT